jgi:serine/threonine protein kinase
MGESRFPSKYEKLKVLGEGGFGRAYLVRDRETGVQYCLKRNLLGDNPTKARQEGELLSRLDHPNIIRHVESCELSGYLYIAMEFADGGDLDSLINRHRAHNTRMEERTIMSIFSQVSAGLTYLHSQRILHRDIKPMNIFLMKDGSAKLGDFGIARVLAAGSMAHTWTGTPTYLAPEVWNGETYGPKADVWSLGCLLYEMCMKRTPFEGRSVASICAKVMRGRYTPISGPYSADLGRLIGRMLLRAPTDRPSAAQLLNVPIIRRYLSAQGTMRTPPEAADPRRTTRREEQPEPEARRPARAARAASPAVAVANLEIRRMQRKGTASDDGEDDASPMRPRGRSPGPPRSNAGDPAQREGGDPRRFRPPPELMESICAARRQREWTGDDSGDEASEGDE